MWRLKDKMKKKLVVFLIVILSVFSLPLFAEESTSSVKIVIENLAKDSNDTSSPTTLDEKIEQQEDELNDKQTKKKTKSMLKRIGDGLKNVRGVISFVAGYIENVMTRFEQIIMSPFKFGKNSGASIVFSIVMAIFLILSMAYYIIEIVTNPQFQMREIPLLFFKCIFLICAFYFLPQMAVVLKNFAWRCAEIITGSNVQMEYSIGTRFISDIIGAIGLVTGVGLIAGSFWVPAIGSISSFAFGIGFAGFLSVMSSTLIYCTWVLELYIATYVLAWYLPSCVFKGFNYNLMNVFKFYFVNTLEVFMGAVIFLIVVKMPMISIPDGETGNVASLVVSLVKPLIVAIFLPAVSKIIGAITSGSSLADTSGAAGGAFRRMAGTIGLGATAHKLGGLISGGKGKLKNWKKQKAMGDIQDLNNEYDVKSGLINRLNGGGNNGGNASPNNNTSAMDNLNKEYEKKGWDMVFNNMNRAEKKRAIKNYGSVEKAREAFEKQGKEHLEKGDYSFLDTKK